MQSHHDRKVNSKPNNCSRVMESVILGLNFNSQMKKILVFGLAFVFAPSLYSQTPGDEMQMFQTMFGMPKKEIVSEFVKIDGPKNEVFWKLYDEYEGNRKQLGQKRFLVLNNYVKNYTKLTAAETDEIIEDIILLSTSQDKLIARYYNKIKKEVSITAAAQFYQIEWYLQSQVRTNILESIPMINELEKKSK
jgi:hypothetical protein